MVFSTRKYYKFHVCLFATLSFQFFVFMPVSFISKFLAAAVCIGVLLNIGDIKFEYRRWLEIIVFLLLNAYITFAIFGYDLFIERKTASVNLSIFYFGPCFIWTSYVLQSFLNALDALSKIKDRLCLPSNDKYWKKWLVLFALMVALFMIWQRAFNPIVLSPDSWGYFNNKYMVVGRSVIYVFINNLIVRIAPTNPAVEWIAFVQITLFSCLLSTILMYLHKKWIRFRWVVVTAVILPLIPSFGLHTIVVWADLHVGMMVLWVTYALVRIIDEIIINKTASSRQQISLCIQLCVAMVLLYFAKANTSVVYLVTAFALFAFFAIQKQRRLLLTITLSTVLVLLIRFPVHSAFDAIRNANLDACKFYAGIHDMQATYYNYGNFSEKNLAYLKKYIPNIDELRDSFRPDWVARENWGNLREVHESATIGEFISAYADTFIRNPYQMSRSMLYRSRTYWVIDTKGNISCVNYINIYDPSTNTYGTQAPEIGVYRQPNFLTDIMSKYMAVMILPVPAMFIWRYGVWTAIMMISIAMLVWQKRYIWLLTYVPVLTHLATLFLTSGWTDYRYGLPVVFVGMFLPSTLFLTRVPSRKARR